MKKKVFRERYKAVKPKETTEVIIEKPKKKAKKGDK